ncbi:MAG TPA: hypothetical protein VJ841_04615 [Candidatus Saccharimonadales bacterium]|nr:hypothetical protein [Candidatus Saccharimonadales bacterium]
MARWLLLPAGKVLPDGLITLRDNLVATVLSTADSEATVRIDRIITLSESGKSRKECVVKSISFELTEDGEWFRGEQPEEIYTAVAKPTPVDGRKK